MELNREALMNLDPKEAIALLLSVVETLTEENAALKARLAQNSRNSSLPPSSDRFIKAKPTRKPSGRNPGGQPGHAGSGLKPPTNPDFFVTHEPMQCENCPDRVVCKANRDAVTKTRYETDIEIRTVSTAHRQVAVVCPKSSEVMYGTFPHGITGFMQYGPNLKALAVSLNAVGMVGMARTHEILKGVFGVTLSPGTVANMVESCAKAVSDTVSAIKEAVTEAPVVHFDETGTRVGKATEWVHVASTEQLTYMDVDAKRGAKGMNRTGILPEFTGTGVHDCYAAYFTYEWMKAHSLCNAHLLRELTAMHENHGQSWAKDLTELLLEMKCEKEKLMTIGEREAPNVARKSFGVRYDRLMQTALMANPVPKKKSGQKGRVSRGKVGALVDRLMQRKANFLLFFMDFSVPFDNNQAERDIRMMKVKQKVSGCFRSKKGARGFAAIMSFIGTARKRGLSAYVAIRDALMGKHMSPVLLLGTE